MKLSVAEKFILFCLDDQTGRFRALPERSFEYGLAGALLEDLAEADWISVSPERVEVRQEVSEATEADTVRSAAMTVLRKLERPSLQGALGALAGESSHLRDRVLKSLVDHGLLSRHTEEFLWFFHWDRYETLSLTEEIAVAGRLRKVIIEEGEEATREELVLIALIEVCQLGSLLFSHAEWERYRERIRALARADSIGCAVRDSLVEIQRAMLEVRAYSGM
ncbi:MAG: GOLPH3/VPS74 family protein [Opitutales bacterium]